MAREFANMIYEKCPKIKIRFLGLFDTVPQVGSPDRYNVNPGVRLDIPDNVEYVAHAVSMDEKRALFPLTSIIDTKDYGGWELNWYMRGPSIWPKKYKSSEINEYQGINYWEKPFRGDHSSIGGGHASGTNLDALNWMRNVGLSHHVPFTIKNYEGKEKYKFPENYDWHDSRWFGDKWRTQRTVYKGNIKHVK